MNENPFAAPQHLNLETIAPPSAARWPRWLTLLARVLLVSIYAALWALLLVWLFMHLVSLTLWIVFDGQVLPISHTTKQWLKVAFYVVVSAMGLGFGWVTRRAKRWHRFCMWAGLLAAIPLAGLTMWVYAQPKGPGWHAIGPMLAVVHAMLWTIAAGLLSVSGLLGWVIRRTYSQKNAAP